MVSPSSSPEKPSKVEIEIFCLDSSNIVGCSLNRWLEPKECLRDERAIHNSRVFKLIRRIRDSVQR
jgi:hypothetical protein